jgi:hypothetical protein
VYGESRALGYDDRSVQAWAADADGAVAAFGSLSRSTSQLRGRVRRHEAFDKGDFFENAKPAEDDRNHRHGK